MSTPESVGSGHQPNLEGADVLLKALDAANFGSGTMRADQVERLQNFTDQAISRSTTYDELITAVREWSSPSGFMLGGGGSTISSQSVIDAIEEIKTNKGRGNYQMVLQPGVLKKKLEWLYMYGKMR